MNDRADRDNPPKSEQNPPEDLSLGWKPFSLRQKNGEPTLFVTVQ